MADQEAGSLPHEVEERIEAVIARARSRGFDTQHGYTDEEIRAAARWEVETEMARQTARQTEREAIFLLRQIIDDLPSRRNWLDPALERAARDLLKRVDAQKGA